ncbi:MAG: hypothetical protein ACYCS8_02025 [Acidithiobacillus sp.]
MAKHQAVEVGNARLIHKQYDLESLRRDCYRLNLDYFLLMKATAQISAAMTARIFKQQEGLIGIVRTAPPSYLAQGALALSFNPAFGPAIPPQAESILGEVVRGRCEPEALAAYLAAVAFR